MSDLIEVERNGLSLLLLPGEDVVTVMAAIEAMFEEQVSKPALGLPVDTSGLGEPDYLDSVLSGLRDGTIKPIAHMSDELIDEIDAEWIGAEFGGVR